jgi:hypothetical protein
MAAALAGPVVLASWTWKTRSRDYYGGIFQISVLSIIMAISICRVIHKLSTLCENAGLSYGSVKDARE